MKLKKGQILYIDNQKYTVINMIEFQETTWIWQEYEMVNENHEHKWLVVEEKEKNNIEYAVFRKYRGNVDTNEIEFTKENKTYELYEKGVASVKDYFGNADVDKFETCVYYEYITKDKTEIIAIEKWQEETEKSIGHYIPNERIQITEEFDKIKTNNNNRKKNKKDNIFIILGILFSVLPIIISLFSGLFVNKSIQKYLEKATTKYTYVTSVTNNTNHKKAKVYESSFSDIDSTVKDVIDGVPEGITDTIDTNPDTEADGIGLQTSNEYAYIYQENGKIYIQVSSKDYVKRSGNMYHSRHHHNYYNTYNSTRRSEKYSSYATSARQRSVNSRTSSGGGTSSGK